MNVAYNFGTIFGLTILGPCDDLTLAVEEKVPTRGAQVHTDPLGVGSSVIPHIVPTWTSKGMQQDGPKSHKRAEAAMILHTVRVQVAVYIYIY